jgi:hemolysin III
MNDREVSAVPSHHPTAGEELVHAATHGVGAVLSLAVLVSLVGFALVNGSTQNVVSAAVFGTSLLLVYVSSTAYHFVSPTRERTKELLRICDHAAIHLLIAGTATPIILCAIGGRNGWIALGVMWSLALFGLIVETTALRKRTRLSIGVYLGNGWVSALALPTLYTAMSTWSLSFLLLGGLAYTAGVPFFLAHRTKWMHACWHGFVLAGSALHVAAVVLVMR